MKRNKVLGQRKKGQFHSEISPFSLSFVIDIDSSDHFNYISGFDSSPFNNLINLYTLVEGFCSSLSSFALDVAVSVFIFRKASCVFVKSDFEYKSDFAHPHGWRWFSFACQSQPSNNCLILETEESTYGTASKRPCK